MKSNYFGDGTRLKGLADAHVPGLEATCGSLGHGLSVAWGWPLAAKRRGTITLLCHRRRRRSNEGSIWERCCSPRIPS